MNRSVTTPSRLMMMLLPIGTLLAAPPQPIEACATPALSPDSPDELERQIAEKRDALLGVVRELRSREFPDASAGFDERRVLTLDRLERYALSERFTRIDVPPSPLL